MLLAVAEDELHPPAEDGRDLLVDVLVPLHERALAKADPRDRHPLAVNRLAADRGAQPLEAVLFPTLNAHR